jgi:hypothetical protein
MKIKVYENAVKCGEKMSENNPPADMRRLGSLAAGMSICNKNTLERRP